MEDTLRGPYDHGSRTMVTKPPVQPKDTSHVAIFIPPLAAPYTDSAMGCALDMILNRDTLTVANLDFT